MCAFCGKIDENFLCEKCNKKFEKLTNVHIQKYKNKTYAEHIYMFKYTDIRREILEYKFDDKAYYYKTISQVFLKNKKICEILKTYDIIIPVPIHNKRRKERGYNQSELIARAISKTLGIPIVKNVLVKIKNTVPQSSLNKVQRAENAKGVYSAKNHTKLRNKKILLIDDIYTTGSTLNECANALIQKGIKREQIGVLTLAKD